MKTRLSVTIVAALLLSLPVAFGQPAPAELGRLFALDFWDPTNGMGLADVVAQETINIVKTTDAGANFSILYSLRRESVTEIVMAGTTGSLGIIIGRNAVFRSTNGGRRWNKSRLAFDMSKLRFVGNKGFVIGTPTNMRGDIGPQLLVTSSKGLRWDPRQVQPSSVQDYCFGTETFGWVIDDAGLQMTTNARTFTLKKPFEQSIAVGCSGEQHVWVLVGSKVHHSADAGATWTEQDTGSRAVFTSMQFVDTTHGWLYSDRELRATDDGGRTWTLRMRAMGPPRFSDATKGWALGGNGDIYRTNDGGRTWSSMQPALAAPAAR
jgi:photosystem II stability/assembly factor-like uncharacterized protein